MGKNIFIIAWLVIAFQTMLAQPAVDGFMKGKGNMAAVTSVTVDNFSQYFADPGLVPISRTTTSFSAFMAAGITNWLDIQMNIPYVLTANKWSNFQDISVFAKMRFFQKDLVTGTFDMMATTGFLTPLSNYPTQGLNAIGQQATALDGRLVMQYFNNSGWFVMAQGGYTYRTAPTPESLPLALKFGKAAADYYVDFYYDFQQASGGSNYLDGTNPLFTSLSVTYHKIGGSYYKPFKDSKAGIAVGVYGVLFGRNVGQSIGGNIAFIYNIKYLKP